MSEPIARYLLFSESGGGPEPGHWRFVLRSADGSERLVADDVEPHIRGERLELLTVVRGLERLDRPARVTLMTASPYVREGIRRGVAEWRKNNWQWEFFGQMAPVRNRDLWERVDRAMQYHQVDCRTWRFDQAHALPAPTASRIPGPGPGRIVRSLGLLRSLRAWARYLVRVCNTTIKAGSPDQKQGLAGAC